MAHLTGEIQDQTICIPSQAWCCPFQDTDENQNALFVFLRLLSCPETGKALFSSQQLAEAFGNNDRREMNTVVRDFVKRGGDFLHDLARKNPKKDRVVQVIARQILDAPLLGIAEHDRLLCEAYPHERSCEQTFRNDVNEIAVTKILKRGRQRGFKKEQSLDVRRYLQELIDLPSLTRVNRKEVVETFPEVEPVSTSQSQGRQRVRLASGCLEAKLLSVGVDAWGRSQEMLALLFGVGTTSMHNWLSSICSEALNWQMIRDIARWSGQVSGDEPWITITGTWYGGRWAVDAVSGFPLLVDLYPTLETLSWTLLFKRFNARYGVPNLIQRDGSQAVAAAREPVCAGVRYQGWKFQTLKNRMKRLRHHGTDPKLLTGCHRLARPIFSNGGVSRRTSAAQKLRKLRGDQILS